MEVKKYISTLFTFLLFGSVTVNTALERQYMENAQCSREENGHNISVPENSSLLCFAQCGPTGLIRYLLLSDIADIQTSTSAFPR